jgi:hypothetical protein
MLVCYESANFVNTMRREGIALISKRIIMATLSGAIAVLGLFSILTVVDGVLQIGEYHMKNGDEPTAAAYVPVQGIPEGDAEKIQLNKLLVAMMGEEISEAVRENNSGVWYRLDSAYVDSIVEAENDPSLYQVVIFLHTEFTTERMQFNVAPGAKPILIDYKTTRVTS